MTPRAVRWCLGSGFLFLLLMAAPGGTLRADEWSDLYRRAVAEEQARRFTSAETAARQLVAFAERGESEPRLAASLALLANVRYELANYAEAEALYRRALEIQVRTLGEEHVQTASTLHHLGLIVSAHGSNAEARPLMHRSLAVREKLLGREHEETAITLGSLAIMYYQDSRFAEAEPMLQRTIRILERTGGTADPDTAWAYQSLANLYQAEQRHQEALPLFEKALKSYEAAYGENNPSTGQAVDGLAGYYFSQGMLAKAETLYRRAIAIKEKVHGPDHPETAAVEHGLAAVYRELGEPDKAKALWERAVVTWEKMLGPEHRNTTVSLIGLASIAYSDGRYEDARRLVDRCIANLEKTGSDPDLRHACYRFRAELNWEEDKKEAAVADLDRALRLAETIRGQGSGGEQSRALLFGAYGSAFELMIRWQADLQDPALAFSTLERFRARSLIDQLRVQGTDLLDRLPAAEAAALRKREADAQAAVAAVTEQLGAIALDKTLSEVEREQRREVLLEKLAAAQRESVEAYAAVRNASPAYRLMVQADFRPIALEKWQAWLRERKALSLEYYFGSYGGYVLIAGGEEGPRIELLDMQEEQAVQIDQQPGPLVDWLLERAFRMGDTTVVQRLAKPGVDREANRRLGLLWNLLIPALEREALTSGKYEQLIVIPDGPLVGLPFETLVVGGDAEPKYLLDAGPPIVYAPSATVVYNLGQRQAAAVKPGTKPILSIADPNYRGTGSGARPSSETLAALAAGTRYGTAGGKLSPLPHTNTESQWIADVFERRGLAAGYLRETAATEKWVRHFVPGRKVVHLACHGMADREHGNFFGALALTPGPDAATNPADDGFLTLPEIYELDLTGCELAILSACETNQGPTQRGEGMWAISRGFLVAGSRRVVASNWLVDDEAAASLVSYYCSGVARAEETGTPAGYAASLHAAKKWVRSQEKWKSPYYWAPLVHLGPP